MNNSRVHIYEKFLGYYRSHRNKFKGYYETLMMGMDVEAVHELRLSNKRIRSLFNLLKFISDGDFDKKRYYADFKPVFKSLSDTRDLHVQLDLFNKQDKGVQDKSYAFRSFLLEQLELSVKHFYQWNASFDLPDLKVAEDGISRFRVYHEQSIIRGIKNCIQGNAGKILQIAEELSDEAELHEIRTKLKETHYIMDIANMIMGAYSENFLAEMKQVENILGEWHDLLVAESFIQSFEHQKQDGLTLLKDYYSQKRNTLFREAMKETPVFINNKLKL